MSYTPPVTAGTACPNLVPPCCILTLTLLLTAGCNPPGKPRPEDQYERPRDVKSFETLFQQNCVACHGAGGTLGPGPPLADKLFLALVPDGELLRVITDGRRGTPMPAFGAASGGTLTEAQVKILAEGIKPQWGPVASVSPETPSYLLVGPKSPSAGNQEAGRKAFAQACACCHGDQGQGGADGGKADRRAVGAINAPEFLALISDQALRRYIITGRPDLGMPNYADAMGRPEGFRPLTSQEVTDLVALLGSWRKGAPSSGEGELTMPEAHHPSPPSSEPLPGRRSLLKWLTFWVRRHRRAGHGCSPGRFSFGGPAQAKIQWVKLGPPSKFPPNETRLETFDSPLGQPWDGMTAHTGVYVRYLGKNARQEEQFLVFAVNCAHLGCPVSWFPQSGLFMCPCHGGVYYANGERRLRAAAARPVPVRLAHSRRRQLEVQAPHYPDAAGHAGANRLDV